LNEKNWRVRAARVRESGEVERCVSVCGGSGAVRTWRQCRALRGGRRRASARCVLPHPTLVRCPTHGALGREVEQREAQRLREAHRLLRLGRPRGQRAQLLPAVHPAHPRAAGCSNARQTHARVSPCCRANAGQTPGPCYSLGTLLHPPYSGLGLLALPLLPPPASPAHMHAHTHARTARTRLI